MALFGPYVLAVEIASMLLLAGLVGSFHLGRRYLERDNLEKQGEPIMDGLNIPLNHILLVSSLLFAIGMLGLMIRRNIIFILMSLEVMLNAAALAFVAAGCPLGAA